LVKTVHLEQNVLARNKPFLLGTKYSCLQHTTYCSDTGTVKSNRCFLGYNKTNPLKPTSQISPSPIPPLLIPPASIPLSRLLVDLIITAGTKILEVQSSPSKRTFRKSDRQTDRVDKPKLVNF
jgi:hypothetical protein